MIYNQNEGFSNHLTNYMLLKDNNIIEGSPRAFKVKDGTITFTSKTLEEKLNTNPDLVTEFYSHVDKLIDSKLTTIDLSVVEEQAKNFDLTLKGSNHFEEE